RRRVSHRRLGLARCPGPENQLEFVPLGADGQKLRPIGRRVLNPLLQAEDVRVEVERPVLVAHEHAGVEDLLQHGCSSGRRGHYLGDTRRLRNVTARGARSRALAWACAWEGSPDVRCLMLRRDSLMPSNLPTPTGDLSQEPSIAATRGTPAIQ